MERFTIYNPTKLHFGAGVVDNLGKSTAVYGKKILLVYGKGSVIKYGYYDQVVNQLKSTGLEIVEYGGIKPNPVIEDVRKASDLGKKEGVETVVALGGGSVIDSAKIIALSIASGFDGWEIMNHKVKPTASLPLLCVLTLAATGTEMNGAAVVQSHETGKKIGYVTDLAFPVVAFLDPTFTVSVPKNYTAYGIVDLIAHALEAYFGEGEPPVIDQITFDIIKDAIQWGPKLLNNLDNVELRANIMLDATLALNGLTRYGKKNGDWAVHGLGHEISLLYDTAHGATLSIGYIAWLQLQKDRIPERIIKLGKNVFGVNTVEDTISEFRKFFQSINAPVQLSEAGIGNDERQKIIDQMHKNAVSGMHHTLTKEDRETLVDFML
ncbi:MAG: iron-containing alcohol dehydrogenase [Bacteroidales bacterium]|jgi:alcohol dehydrogenase YqhD (iron-dependent ADH family)|nr:iron-containing alcohol dehydrogenase [Bacteroidales bacterium]